MRAIGFLALVGAAATLFGCSDPCADLQESCDRCSGTTKDLCQITVDSGDVQGCSNVLALYEDKCP